MHALRKHIRSSPIARGASSWRARLAVQKIVSCPSQIGSPGKRYNRTQMPKQGKEEGVQNGLTREDMERQFISECEVQATLDRQQKERF